MDRSASRTTTPAHRSCPRHSRQVDAHARATSLRFRVVESERRVRIATSAAVIRPGKARPGDRRMGSEASSTHAASAITQGSSRNSSSHCRKVGELAPPRSGTRLVCTRTRARSSSTKLQSTFARSGADVGSRLVVVVLVVRNRRLAPRTWKTRPCKQQAPKGAALARVRSKTRPELAVRSSLHAMGFGTRATIALTLSAVEGPLRQCVHAPRGRSSRRRVLLASLPSARARAASPRLLGEQADEDLCSRRVGEAASVVVRVRERHSGLQSRPPVRSAQRKVVVRLVADIVAPVGRQGGPILAECALVAMANR